jgi:hypothetical protein
VIRSMQASDPEPMTSAGIEPETLTLAARLVRTLSSKRFRLDSEKLLQDQIAHSLAAAGFTARREAPLADGDVIDFLVGDVGIEAKIKGQRRAILRQCERYCRCGALGALVLVTNAPMGFPPALVGKPTFVVSLGRAWLG